MATSLKVYCPRCPSVLLIYDKYVNFKDFPHQGELCAVGFLRTGLPVS